MLPVRGFFILPLGLSMVACTLLYSNARSQSGPKVQFPSTGSWDSNRGRSPSGFSIFNQLHMVLIIDFRLFRKLQKRCPSRVLPPVRKHRPHAQSAYSCKRYENSHKRVLRRKNLFVRLFSVGCSSDYRCGYRRLHNCPAASGRLVSPAVISSIFPSGKNDASLR